MKTCTPYSKVEDLACLECLLCDYLDGLAVSDDTPDAMAKMVFAQMDERGTLEIVEVAE
jgi:hypothetical protein